MSTAADSDAKILELLGKVGAQKAEIAEIERPSYRTNRVFFFVEGDPSRPHNLAVTQDIAALLKMAAHVEAAAAAYAQACTSLMGSEECPPFTWCGYSLEDWQHDLRKRADQVRIKARREKLAQLEARLNAIVSPEKRRELELRSIEAALG